MLKLTVPKSFLRFAKNMTVGELKHVTKKDLLEYTAEFESSLKPDYEEDMGVVSENNNTMMNLSVLDLFNMDCGISLFMLTLFISHHLPSLRLRVSSAGE